ncbi:MAG: autotransporter outer membrane beta-barrel domain-containing protein, partial [Sphingobium sp.]
MPFDNRMFFTRFASISVAGTVDGGGKAGIDIVSGTAANGGFDYFGSQVALTVAQGGIVTGATGVSLAVSPDAQYSSALLTLDNAGSITGSSGVALLVEGSSGAAFSSIINRATGSIGAIVGPVGSLNNAGTISGGTRSAIDYTTGRFNPPVGPLLTNSGAIVSNGSSATIANIDNGIPVTNSGTIGNLGNGAAIDGGILIIVNAVGGHIGTAGATAIRATRYLDLVNAGRIDGSIVMVTDPSQFGSVIDSTAGLISGDVLFGEGDDELAVHYNAGTGPTTGILGRIDGGAGVDTVRAKFLGDATLTTALALPSAFERIVILPEQSVTVTLGDGFASAGPIRIGGLGTIINTTSLSATGGVIVDSGGFSTSDRGVRFVNQASITSSFAADDVFTGEPAYAVQLSGNFGGFVNSGTITSANQGVYYAGGGAFLNSGTILVNGAGIAVTAQSTQFTNSGTIRSTGGTALVVGTGGTATNSSTGRIEGVIGYTGSLVNNGTIVGSTTALLGSVDNRAGGIVTGGVTAVGPVPSTSGFTLVSGSVIQNAGTINGLVNLRSTGYSFVTENRYFALPGGVLNGDLRLGNGNMLIVELAGSDGGRFAGINGIVTAENATLRYRVRADSNGTLSTVAGFTTTAYDLFDGARLTLDAPGVATIPLQFAGTGSVDIAADLTLTDQLALMAGGVASAAGYESTPNQIDIVYRGAMLLRHSRDDRWAAASAGFTTVTNEGSITLIDTTTSPYIQNYVFNYPTSLVNRGTVTISGNAGIVSSATSFINSGTITQTGNAFMPAIQGVPSITNSGSISVSGQGVLLSSAASLLTNSGTLASSNGVAVQSSVSNNRVANLVGGSISGGASQPAIQMAGGVITNAGLITGDVDLSYSQYGGVSAGSGVYVSAGGLLDGRLRFGSGSDLFIESGNGTGVTGTIDGGAGIDFFGHSRSADATIALGAIDGLNFEGELIEVKGASTTVTVTGASSLSTALYLVGDGNIVNLASMSGALAAATPPGLFAASSVVETGLASLTNKASVGAGISGAIDRFVNSGSVTSSRSVAVGQFATGAVGFANSGTITSASRATAVRLEATDVSDISFTNSGAISGNGVSATYYFASDSNPHNAAFSNSGSIMGAGGLSIGDFGAQAGTLTVDNSGTVVATGAGRSALAVDLQSSSDFAITNSGLIDAGAGGIVVKYPFYFSETTPAVALLVSSSGGSAGSIVNSSGGTISADGLNSTAIQLVDVALSLTNAGTISGGQGTTLAEDDIFILSRGTSYLAGAIQSFGTSADSIVNSGTIVGSIDLGGGDDSIVNSGVIRGNVFLGDGNDSFTQRIGGSVLGIVNGGAGIDSFIADATGAGSVDGSQFVNFERFIQSGLGTLSYSGNFAIDTIDLDGSGASVAIGQMLSTSGPATFTGGSGVEQVYNAGAIAGGIVLGGGNDLVENRGAIGSSVSLGGGDDLFIEGVDSMVAGGTDGGAGRDTYIAELGGDRSSIGARTGFEQLGITGSGTLSLTLDQDWNAISLEGTGLDLRLAGFS